MIELRSGDQFAGCKIIDICGKGGHGTVYLAEDATGKHVAVKIVNTNDKKKELEGIRNYMPVSRKSPYLLSVFHVGVEQNELFLVMEAADSLTDSQYYLPDTLAKRLQLHGKISSEESLVIIQKIASAVKILHEEKLIHRDIKPDNVIFVNGEPKLSDPGLICSAEHSITLAGTLGFLPPECFYGTESNSTQSDIYALGKLFYCIVTGEAPGRFPYLPRDLSFSLCRKLLPIFLKSCNTKKKKRYQSISEFLHDLPKKLPRPGLLLRASENFRTWKLIHCRLWNFILLLVGAGCILTLLLYFDHHKRAQIRQEKIAACNMEIHNFRKKINSRNKIIALELTRLLGEERSRSLMKSYSSLPADPEKSAALCREYSNQLNVFAVRAAGMNKKITDALRRAAAKRAFLKSSLGSFLTEAQKEQFREDLLQDEKNNHRQIGKVLKLEKTFYPDSSGIFEFSYVPPGDFIFPATGEYKRIDYPFWVAPAKLTVLQFSRMCLFQPPQSSDLNAAAVRFLWNDILHGCRNANAMFQIVAPFPPGYIVRPLTEEEWEYCASRSGFNTENNKNSLYAMGGEIAEIVSSGRYAHRDSVIAKSGAGKSPQKEFAFFQSFLRDVGTRIAIAPGTEDFYTEKLQTGSPQHISFNGKHYEFFGHLCANFKRREAEAVCRLLGGRLASLDSAELIDRINRAASPVINYNICVAADFRDGKWYWQNGKPVQNAPRAPRDGEYFIMTGKKFHLGVTKRYLGFVCEWTEEEFRARTDWKKRIFQWPAHLRKIFRIGDKEYVFLRVFMNYPHLFRRYAELLGGKLAEPETPELQKKISVNIKEFDDKPTLLGGYRYYEKYYWVTSKNEIKEPLARVGQVVDPAPSLSALAIRNGKLCVTQLPHQFLLEFPAPNSSRK